MSEPCRVADYIFQFLAAHGARHVFGVPGGGAMHLVDAVGQNDSLRFVAHHHEQAASIAAEAYSRIDDHLGVALVTSGPGATNAVTGVTGAWIESVPMVVVSGQVKRADLKGSSGVRQMGPQEVDIISMVQHVTKYAVTVMDPADVRFHLEKAVHLATSGRRGPVWLDIPLDVQASIIDADEQSGFDPEPAGGGDLLREDCEAIVELLASARRPLILAGHGVRLAGAASLLRTFCERWQIPVVTTWNAMDLIPADHPLAVGKPGTVALRGPNFAVQNADCLLILGARLDNVVTAFNPANFGRGAQRVMVDVDPAEIRKLHIELAREVVADARDVLTGLNELPVKRMNRDDWIERCQHWKRRYRVCDGQPFATAGTISHFHLVDALSDLIEPDTLVVTGSSGLGVEVFYTAFRNKPGQRVFLTSGLGAMGYGLAAAIGASLSSGAERVVLVESDGSLQMNLQELNTIRALDLPLTIILMNNAGYASIRNTQRTYFNGRYVGTGPEAGLSLPDLPRLAAAMDIKAVEIRDASGLYSGLREALSQRGPLLCDVHLEPNEILWPKVSAIPQPDGSMTSMPLEDMSPLLPRDELRENMILPLAPESERIEV